MFRKTFVLLFSAVVLSACAGGVRKDGRLMAGDKKTASIFCGGENTAAFKLDSVIRDLSLQGVLIIKKTGPQDYTVKMMGPLGSKVMEGAMSGSTVTYDYVLPDINTAIIKNRFEKFLFALLLPPGEIRKTNLKKDGTFEIKRKVGDSLYTYVYEETDEYPSRMQSGAVQMTFGGYEPHSDGMLPYTINYYDNFADVGLTLGLISLR